MKDDHRDLAAGDATPRGAYCGTGSIARGHRQRRGLSNREAARELAAELMPWMPYDAGYHIREERADGPDAGRRVPRRNCSYEFAIVNDMGRYLGGCGLVILTH